MENVAHFEFGLTTYVEEFARNDYFMSMGSSVLYGGIQSSQGGEGYRAIFSVWTRGGTGQITYLNTDWGFEGR